MKSNAILIFWCVILVHVGHVLWWRKPSFISPSAIVECPATVQSPTVQQPIAVTLDQTPIGSLGPAKTERENFIYYDSLFYLALQFGRTAKTVLEVGCALDPFVQYLGWIPSKTCVAPYRVIYKNASLSASRPEQHVDFIEADFVEFEVEKKWDLTICSQVVEHVLDPPTFVRKLVESAQTTIISAPYMWPECGSRCNHLSHNITLETITTWAQPYKPQHHAVIEEQAKGPKSRRIIVVFQDH